MRDIVQAFADSHVGLEILRNGYSRPAVEDAIQRLLQRGGS